MIALRREPWLIMSGESMDAGNSLVGGGSMVTAAGICCANAVRVSGRKIKVRAVTKDRVGVFMAGQFSLISCAGPRRIFSQKRPREKDSAVQARGDVGGLFGR